MIEKLIALKEEALQKINESSTMKEITEIKVQ